MAHDAPAVSQPQPAALFVEHPAKLDTAASRDDVTTVSEMPAGAEGGNRPQTGLVHTPPADGVSATLDVHDGYGKGDAPTTTAQLAATRAHLTAQRDQPDVSLPVERLEAVAAAAGTGAGNRDQDGDEEEDEESESAEEVCLLLLFKLVLFGPSISQGDGATGHRTCQVGSAFYVPEAACQ